MWISGRAIYPRVLCVVKSVLSADTFEDGHKGSVAGVVVGGDGGGRNEWSACECGGGGVVDRSASKRGVITSVYLQTKPLMLVHYGEVKYHVQSRWLRQYEGFIPMVTHFTEEKQK